MKDTKFIELLNLYIDHQISPADAALLEAELQENPHRRRTYRQYCQMHHGCTLVGENFHAPAMAPSAGNLRAFRAPAGRRWNRGFYAAGLAAAAAVIALVLVRVSPRSAPTATAVARATAQTAAATPEAGSSAVQFAPTGARQTPRSDDFQVVLTSQALNLFKDDREGAGVAMAPAGESAANQALLNWMNSVQLQPLPRARTVEGFAFEIDNRPSTAQPANRVFTSNPPPQDGPAAELTAFQFQH